MDKIPFCPVCPSCPSDFVLSKMPTCPARLFSEAQGGDDIAFVSDSIEEKPLTRKASIMEMTYLPHKIGRPKKRTVALFVRVTPETEAFIRRKARRKNTLGNIVDRAVRLLAIRDLLS